jgi:hypothetical protein
MLPGNLSQNNTATKQKKKSSWGTLLGGKGKDSKSESKSSLNEVRNTEVSVAAAKDALV